LSEVFVLALLLVTTFGAPPALADEGALTVDDCVRVALGGSPKVAEAQARSEQYAARLRQVQALYYPQLLALTYLAPMFTVDKVPGKSLAEDFKRQWSDVRDWGPYYHFEALVVMPIYTFGRLSRGEDAARHRHQVEEARVREARNVLAMEVRKLYYVYLYTRSIQRPLDSAGKLIKEALTVAREKFDRGTGEVTLPDVMKLTYFDSELEKYRLQASEGSKLALAALRHTMGLPDGASLTLADNRLPKEYAEGDQTLAQLINQSSRARPEWAQIRQGKLAALSLEAAERLAYAPVVFVGGSFEYDWAPTRADTSNPYLNDQYNDLAGGVAVGLRFEFNLLEPAARADEAAAKRREVEALERFAATGIPLQVRKAHNQKQEYRNLVKLSRKGVKATRKWMVFAGAAFLTGTGEARDLLEGAGAYVQALQSYFEQLKNFYIADAELRLAVGADPGSRQ
jgi:outer membrane protein TolC